ncbi:hypothetical protein jhhlp_002873 [Lomentospora prolificans]|uniref:Amidase domain-containing protein n=1 Tax=Lomentospora prolificans TaxID=41688 RepID=A0A2N3NFG6_9PEZI|nr:hypothetical protein jhhlp_002873 [Lomentospora prolificans]
MVSVRSLILPAIFALSSFSKTVNGQDEETNKFPALRDATIDDLAQGLKDRLFTSVDLVKAYIARIEEVNSELRAVTEINPDALDIAAALDAEREDGEVRGQVKLSMGSLFNSPLHGLPILIKNNIATADEMNNTAGSLALKGAKVPRDSFIAKKLREAGAVILGKANMSQWANYRSSNSSNGWSAHGGQVLGAYLQDQDSSGSSSGCGVASDLGLAVACIGTETDGSIVSPSQRNNIVGFKPTIGLTSRDLVIPISEHQDTIGPMARTVKDAAYILQAIAGVDENDAYTSDIPDGLIPDYLAALDEDALAGARLGIPSNALELFGMGNADHPETHQFYVAFDVLRIAGATVVGANFTGLSADADFDVEGRVLDADLVVNLASYLAQLTENPADVHSLQDIRDFTRSTPGEEYPDRNTATWDGALQLGYNNTDAEFEEDLEKLRGYGNDWLLGAIEDNELDAVILPTSAASLFAAWAAAPLVSVPMGFWPDDAEVVRNARGLATQGPGLP